MYFSEEQRKIIDAFLFVASQNKKTKDITMLKVATAAGLNAWSIYKKHFQNVDDIVESVEEIILTDLETQLSSAKERDMLLSPFVIIADSILPNMYDQQLKYKIYFRLDIFPDLFASMERLFGDWLRPYLKEKLPVSHLPREVFLHVETQFLVSTLFAWLAEDTPIPISLYHDEFLKIIQMTHLDESIDPKYYTKKAKI